MKRSAKKIESPHVDDTSSDRPSYDRKARQVSPEDFKKYEKELGQMRLPGVIEERKCSSST